MADSKFTVSMGEGGRIRIASGEYAIECRSFENLGLAMDVLFEKIAGFTEAEVGLAVAAMLEEADAKR